jgi:hypothetical protein
MEIKISIESNKIKKSIGNFKSKTISNKKNIAIVLIALYIIGSIFYISIDVAMSLTNSHIFEGVCENISDHNLTMNGMTLYFFSSFSNTTKEMMEGNRIKIDCYYSEKRQAWHWATIEKLDYQKG